MAERQQQLQAEIIYVNKVYNECSIVECRDYRIPIPHCFPPAVNVIDCAVTEVAAEGVIVGSNDITVTANFTLNVEYDTNGETQFIQQTAQFRQNGIRLEGALPGMNVIILPLIRCLDCEVLEGGLVIQCSVGIYFIVKAVALVQLEVMGRFSDEPPACEQVSPLGCAQWFEMAEAGEFWPPFPPQPSVLIE